MIKVEVACKGNRLYDIIDCMKQHFSLMFFTNPFGTQTY